MTAHNPEHKVLQNEKSCAVIDRAYSSIADPYLGVILTFNPGAQFLNSSV
jgi:hypothetical protein